MYSGNSDEFNELTANSRGNEPFLKENATHVFRVGEELTVKGKRLKVIKVTPKKVICKFLPSRRR